MTFCGRDFLVVGTFEELFALKNFLLLLGDPTKTGKVHAVV
jgi:hypothetical protein